MGIVMGRLLNATDYGMIAMISIFALVANDLQNSGFKAALNNIKQPQHRDYNSVFWFNIAMGGGLYVLLSLRHSSPATTTPPNSFRCAVMPSYPSSFPVSAQPNRPISPRTSWPNKWPKPTSPAPSCLALWPYGWHGAVTAIGHSPRKPTFTCSSTPYSIGTTRIGDPHSASIGNPLGTCSSSAASCCSRRYSPTSTTTS